VSPSTRFVRNVLVIVFMTGFGICLAAVGIAYLRGAIYADMLKDMVVQLLAIYSMPLGAIIGGVFGQRGSGDAPAPAQAFWLALAIALLWNALLVVRIVAFGVAREDDLALLTAYLKEVSAAAGFLVAGVLAYYFARNGSG
jgi:hypothetical protein